MEPAQGSSMQLRHTLTMLAALCLLSLSACDKKANEPTANNAQPTTEEKQPDAGAQKVEAPQIKKLIFAFQPQENPEGLAPNAKKLAEFLQTKLGVECEVFLPTSYAAVVEALRSENAHVAYFSGWPYLIAHEKADVDIILAETRAGQPFYYSQWYVLQDSPAQSLADLKGKNIAFTSPTSTSGYLFPLAKVIDEGHLKTGQDPKEFFAEILFAGGYEQALKALVNGKVDAAAASDYAFTRYLSEDEQKKVRVLTKQGPVPTHGIGVSNKVPQELRDKIRDAFLELNKDENKELLKSVYGAEQLVPRTHQEHIQALDAAQKSVGADFSLENKK